MLAFTSSGDNTWEMYSVNLRDGKQTSVSAGSGEPPKPVMNSTGTSITYPHESSLWQVPSSGGLPRKLLNRYFVATDWSSDSHYLLGIADSMPGSEITILDAQTQELTRFLVGDGRRSLWQAHFSDDGVG
jgi:Tol biopolymer transport system component